MEGDTVNRVLIVDDEPYICDLLSKYLKSDGYDCDVAYSGDEALVKLKDKPYRLVLADIMMPGMSGLDLLTFIKPLYPDLAVLMVTAVDDKDTGLQAIEMGAYGYIIKPFERNEILINVAQAIERSRLMATSRKDTGNEAPKFVLRARREPIRISASKVLECIRAGMDDAALMKEFGLSAKALHSLFDQMIAAGKMTEADLNERRGLAPGTVIMEVEKLPLPEEKQPSGKPVIDAKEAIEAIRSGMSDHDLMEKFNVSAKGVQSLLRKLVAAGVVTQAELDKRMSESHNWALLEEDAAEGL
jgi:CheY-like chemotaxis protein